MFGRATITLGIGPHSSLRSHLVDQYEIHRMFFRGWHLWGTSGFQRLLAIDPLAHLAEVFPISVELG